MYQMTLRLLDADKNPIANSQKLINFIPFANYDKESGELQRQSKFANMHRISWKFNKKTLNRDDVHYLQIDDVSVAPIAENEKAGRSLEFNRGQLAVVFDTSDDVIVVD